jgi:FkbM family methyltransferase
MIIHNYIRTIVSILQHPFNRKRKVAAIFRFIKWQIQINFFYPEVVVKITSNAKMIVSKGLTGVTGCIYNGIHEYNETLFILHFLRKDDSFYDVGANVGIYSVLVGCENGCQVFAFEPVRSTFEKLKINIEINNLTELVTLRNIGIGESRGLIEFTTDLDTVNHVSISGEDILKECVQIEKLDDIVNPNSFSVIKIDVEGYEMAVLKGSKNILKNNNLIGIIIELNGCGQRYGYIDAEINEMLLGYGFQPYDYCPHSRMLMPLKTWGTHNTLYLRNIEFVRKRLINSTPITIQGIAV